MSIFQNENFRMKILNLQWPIVIVTTIVLYMLILVNLPFDTINATLFLFTLIAFWSRLPGVGISVDPMWIFYNLDVIDVFCIIISINVSGFHGAIFAFFCNMWSRLCGISPSWLGCTKDALFQSFLCLFIPLIFHITSSLAAATIFFTVGRSILFLTVGMMMPHRSIFNQILTEIQFQASLLIINLFYVSLIGNFFTNLLQKGVKFSWILFLFATAVILAFYILSYSSPSRNRHTLLKALLKKTLAEKKATSFIDSDTEEIKLIKETL